MEYAPGGISITRLGSGMIEGARGVWVVDPVAQKTLPELRVDCPQFTAR